MEKINVVYSNNGWNVRNVAKYNFLIPVWAPSLPPSRPPQPASQSPSLTITSCLTVHLDQAISHLLTADSRYHILPPHCGQGGAVLGSAGWCEQRCRGLLTDCQAAAARTSCAQLRRPPAPARTAAAACRVSADPADHGPRNAISSISLYKVASTSQQSW